MARYGEGFGNDYRTDENRDRWREEDRERSSWRSGQGPREFDDERGFFQRAGDEIRSWFSEEDERSGREYGQDYERCGISGRSSWDRDDYSRSRSGGWPVGSSSDREREQGYGRVGRGSDHLSRDRSDFGSRAQVDQLGRSTSNWDRDRERGFGHPRTGGSWPTSSNRDRFDLPSRSFGGFRDEGDFRRQRRDHPQSWSEANRGENESLGFGEFRGTLGGFGNQTFGSSEHDHYRNWRNREMAKLDRDYDDYCREREHQFNQDFDSWRRNRLAQNPTAANTSAELGSSSNAGVGTTNPSITGSAGAGSAPGSATTHGGSTQSEATETAGTSGGRSGSRSRS